MSEFAVKAGRIGGVHQEVHIYAGPAVGSRAHAGVLVFRTESAQRFIEALAEAGFDRLTDRSVLTPPTESRDHG